MHFINAVLVHVWNIYNMHVVIIKYLHVDSYGVIRIYVVLDGGDHMRQRLKSD